MEKECLGCAMENGEIDHSEFTVIKTKHFNLHQDYEVPIPGFFILSARRHFASITDFTDDEEKEFFELIKKTRNGMKEILGVDEVVLFQNEASVHHFHFWIFSFLPWMKEKGFGKGMKDVFEIVNYAKENVYKDDARLKEAVDKLRGYFNS